MLRFLTLSLASFLFLTGCATNAETVPQAAPGKLASLETIEIVPMFGDELTLFLEENHFKGSYLGTLPLPPSLPERAVSMAREALSPRYEVSVGEDPLIRYDMELVAPVLDETFSNYEVVRAVTEASEADAILFITLMHADVLPTPGPTPGRAAGLGLRRDWSRQTVYAIYGLALIDTRTGEVIVSARARTREPGLIGELSLLDDSQGFPVIYETVLGAGEERRYPGRVENFTAADQARLEQDLLSLLKKSLPYTLEKMGLADAQ